MYDPTEIEPRWQRYWQEANVFQTEATSSRPKYYVLDMFPYPSGAGLHLGHVEGYTATDIVARYKRMDGFNVLHPMGWDAFGLPAEQYAIEMGIHPMKSTTDNVKTFRRQCDMMGFSYGWDRVIDTSKPDYYRWTQWIFKKMLEHDLAYRSEALVNWCPALGTVLANDEVIDGKSERGGHPVIRKPMMQWMLRITAYAERLLADLEKVDYPESIVSMQRDRIGRSEGADVTFAIVGSDEVLEVFTTRPDTLFGATFCVVAPEHPLVAEITTPARKAAVDAYLAEVASKSDLERSGSGAGKTGVDTGGLAINPVNGEQVPIWVADYVLVSHGTGAIMSVPAHDSRDWEFARTFALPIVEVIQGGDVENAAWEGRGPVVNSGFLDGLDSQTAISRINDWLEEHGKGERKVRYKMRDWIFARQRYWGEPVPVIHDEHGGIHPLPDDELPLELPMLEDFKPSGSGEAPLERLPEWVRTTVPGTDEPGRRETHTMPTLAGSSWYFLRFIDPHNASVFCDFDAAQEFMPVDLYVGGAEHAVGHLLYSRFFTKFLYDLGLCPVDEPYAKLVNQGIILGPDRRKMGKRFGNAISPNDVVEQYGADALRVFEMFLGPIDADKPWSDTGINGARRFLDRVWNLLVADDGEVRAEVTDDEPSDAALRLLHQTIDKVRSDTEALRFNTAIAQMMTFVSEATRWEIRPRRVLEPFVLLLAPYAPHIAEELWSKLGHSGTLAYEQLPAADPELLVDDRCEIVIQMNGKFLVTLGSSRGRSEADILAEAQTLERVQARLDGRPVQKVIYVTDKILNLLVR